MLTVQMLTVQDSSTSHTASGETALGDTAPAAAIEEMLATAMTAPSLHNTQPWRFAVSGRRDLIELYADPERMLRTSDPQGRALTIGCGAALFNLRLAVAETGREPVVRLLPHPAMPRLLAAVRIGGRPPRRARAGGDERALYQATRHRHTNRFPFSDQEIPAAVWRELAHAAAAEGATLARLQGADLSGMLTAVAEAERRSLADPARRAELRSWTTADGRRTDGVPIWAFGPPGGAGGLPLRDFGVGHPDPARLVRRFETVPQLAVLHTPQDTLRAWIQAGQALQRVLLTATRHGVSASFLHQPLEWPDLRALVRPPGSAPALVQMVLRLGYGRPTGPTPRRTPAEVRCLPA